MPVGPPPINPGDETTDSTGNIITQSTGQSNIISDTTWFTKPPVVPNRDQDFFNRDLIGQISDLKLQVAQLKLTNTMLKDRLIQLEQTVTNQRDYNLEGLYQ